MSADENAQSDRTEHKLDKALSALAEVNVRGATLTERLISIEHRVQRTETDVQTAVVELKAALKQMEARLDASEKLNIEREAKRAIVTQIGTAVLTLPWLGAGVVYAIREFLGLNLSQ
jgi:hypothetical protein